MANLRSIICLVHRPLVLLLTLTALACGGSESVEPMAAAWPEGVWDYRGITHCSGDCPAVGGYHNTYVGTLTVGKLQEIVRYQACPVQDGVADNVSRYVIDGRVDVIAYEGYYNTTRTWTDVWQNQSGFQVLDCDPVGVLVEPRPYASGGVSFNFTGTPPNILYDSIYHTGTGNIGQPYDFYAVNELRRRP